MTSADEDRLKVEPVRPQFFDYDAKRLSTASAVNSPRLKNTLVNWIDPLSDEGRERNGVSEMKKLFGGMSDPKSLTTNWEEVNSEEEIIEVKKPN